MAGRNIHRLAHPVEVAGASVAAVEINRPGRADAEAVVAAVNEAERARGAPIGNAGRATFMIARLADLPADVVRKFHVQDARRLTEICTNAFAAAGIS